MQRTTVKKILLALIFASALPLAACSDDNDTPTSPTQPGPPVSDTPTPPTTPPPDPTPPTPPPADDRPIETITGVIANLARSGEGLLDASFRIDDRTIARVSRTTPVTSGASTGDTNFLREGQTVTVAGRRTNGFLDATSVNIIAEAP